MAEILHIENLTKHFGGVVACNDLTFGVEEGHVTGIIGPNGAGKTTLFNLITGVYTPTKGQIIYENEGIVGKKPDKIVRKGIARTFQNIRLFKNLTLLDNVIIALDLRNAKYTLFSALTRMPVVRKDEKNLQKMALEYLDIVGLKVFAQNRADSLPYGRQRKLEIARALALRPNLLLLDEPAAGMNSEESWELGDLIRHVKEKFSLTILLIEHHMDLVMEICDHIVVLNFGGKLTEGTPEEIQNDPIVIKAYLGEENKRA